MERKGKKIDAPGRYLIHFSYSFLHLENLPFVFFFLRVSTVGEKEILETKLSDSFREKKKVARDFQKRPPLNE